MSEFSKKMGVTKKDFKKAQDDIMRGGGGMPKPGRYQCKVIEANVNKVTRGKASGQFASNMRFEILTGKSEGQKFYVGRFLETVKKGRRIGLSMLLGDLERLGIPCNGIVEVEEAVEQALGLIVQMRVYENGQYTNARIEQLIDDGEVEADEDDDLEEEEEETEEESEEEEVEDEEEEEIEEKPKRRKAGRPKGSKNKPKGKGKKKDEDFDDDFLDD